MRFLVDESVSYSLVKIMRERGWEVTAITEGMRSLKDRDIYNLAVRTRAVLITRDYHFTNPVRFPSERTAGIIFIRRGNLRSQDEVALVMDFLSSVDLERIRGRLVTLSKGRVRMRP